MSVKPLTSWAVTLTTESLERSVYECQTLDVLLCSDGDAGKELEPECAAELKEVRHSLLEDYQISPSVEQNCKDDVRLHCARVARRDVIHCLMDVARHQYKMTGKQTLSSACYTDVRVFVL